MKLPILSGILFSVVFPAATARANCDPQGSSWITLEVVASEPAPDEPVEVIDIDRAGCATVRYASFDRRAGLYRRQLGVDERARLAVELESRGILDFDSDATRSQIAHSEQRLRRGVPSSASSAIGSLVTDDPAKAAPRFQVECGDTYRLSVDDAAGTTQLEWYAPKQIAPRHPEVKALTGLVDFIESLQRLAADNAKRRIADVTP